MLSVRGIYEKGRVRLLEPVPFEKRLNVIVTILEEPYEQKNRHMEADIDAFNDMVGVIDEREDGSVSHDKYITGDLK